MARIHVITDSASDLPAAIVAAHGIEVIPLDVRLEGSTAEELRGIDAAEFWKRARASAGLAETAAPSPGAFAQAFMAARDAGFDGVVCVTISSELSATYQSACAGAAELGDSFPIRVVDSRFATMGEGLLVLEAVELAAAGLSCDEVADQVTNAISRTFTFGTLDTLEYLRRGGRIGGAQAFFGSLLSIKPIIDVRNGVVEGESRQRTRAKSFRYLADKIEAVGPLKRFAIAHADAGDVGAFMQLVTDLKSENETILTYIGPVIGAHTGPGTIGVCGIRA